MSNGLTEDDMRKALGLDTAASKKTVVSAQGAKSHSWLIPKAGSATLKLRVTLRVSKIFAGGTVVFTHDANTLSHVEAEQQAKTAARKEGYRFFDLVTIKPI